MYIYIHIHILYIIIYMNTYVSKIPCDMQLASHIHKFVKDIL